MNTIRRPFTARLLAAVALAVPFGFAQAESPTVAPEIDGFVSTLTRAEVRAATAADAAAGRIARHVATPEQAERIRLAGQRALLRTASR